MDVKERRYYAKIATSYITEADRLQFVKSVTNEAKEIENIMRMAQWYDKEG